MQDELSHEVKNSLSVYILAQVLLSEKPEFYYEKFFDFLYIFCISNGTYQNAGQKLIFKTELSVTEVILKLQMPEIQDTLYYDFEKKNGIYFLKINGIKRMGFQGVLKGLFTVEFTEGEETYIVIHRYHSIQNLYASGYEAEIYEFMVKKLDCIPQ